MRGLLAGHRRYAHITALRGDAVAARALGMNTVVSEVALRRALLIRLRQTANVQRLVAQQFARQDWSRPDKQGCRMVEGWLQLHG
jgi:hypothetical protein